MPPVPSRSVSLTRILLIRHGQSTWNEAGRWQGIADPPLTPLGEAQARAAGERLRQAGLDAIVSSDLQRARRTAELVAATLGIGSPEAWPALRERDVGAWTGLTTDQILEQWPNAFGPPRMEPPGAETRAEQAARIGSALRGLLDQFAGQSVAAVVHGGVLRVVETLLSTDRGPIPNLVGWWLEANGDQHLHPGERLFLVDPDAANPLTPVAP